MIENVSDFLSVAVLAALVFFGFYELYAVSVKHREARIRRLEARYYQYYDDADDDSDEEEEGPYYED